MPVIVPETLDTFAWDFRMLKDETMVRCNASDALATALRGSALRLDHLTLRPPTLNDVRPMFSGWATDPEVARYLIWAPHKSDADTMQFLTWAIGHPQAPNIAG
jgi:RimJ/RimL family protein N-acetyltransferase